MNYFARPEAFERLYSEESKAMLAYFTRRVLQADVAVDLLAETYAQAFSGRKQFRGQTKAEASRWVRVIAERQMQHYLRAGAVERRAQLRLGLERPQPSDEDIVRIEELAGVRAILERVQIEMRRLPQEQRDAVQMRVIDEQSFAEIARRAGTSEAVIRSRVSRALRKMNQRLGAFTVEETFNGA